MRVEMEIEIESESSSDAVVDTESSTEEEESVLNLKDMIDGDDDAEGKIDNEHNGPLREPIVPERVDGEQEDAFDEDEEAEGETEDGFVSPARESVVPERVDEDKDTASEPTSMDCDLVNWPGRQSASLTKASDSIVPELADHGVEEEDASSEATSMDSEVPLLERRAKRVAKGKQKAVRKEYGDEGVERERDDGVVSPIRDSVVPERVDDEDGRETSEATSPDTELPLLKRQARRKGKGIQKAVRKDESSDALFVVVSSEEDAKGETDDGFVGLVRDLIAPERVYHDDKDQDATREPPSPE